MLRFLYDTHCKATYFALWASLRHATSNEVALASPPKGDIGPTIYVGGGFPGGEEGGGYTPHPLGHQGNLQGPVGPPLGYLKTLRHYITR
jgi:hypothetical protein